MLYCLLIFSKCTFQNILSGIPSECQTGLIQIRPHILVGPDLGPSCLQRLSADDTSRQRVNTVLVYCSMVYMKSPPDQAENKGKKRKTDRRKSEAQRNLKLVQERR